MAHDERNRLTAVDPLPCVRVANLVLHRDNGFLVLVSNLPQLGHELGMFLGNIEFLRGILIEVVELG